MINVLNRQEVITCHSNDYYNREGEVEETENSIQICYTSIYNEETEMFFNFWEAYPITNPSEAEVLLEEASEYGFCC